MRTYDVIAAKRDGGELTREQIEHVISAYTAGDVPDYVMSALLMAIFLNGMSAGELEVWTSAMLHSGDVLDLSAIPGAKVDKHSTGGVGDKISLPLAPLVAACGVRVPMVSGRGLGHTGGTLDKLESIPGFRVDLSTEDYEKLVAEVGVCLIGQTAQIAPADKKLYALRDVTATVESIPLIASSIMSKKLAEGIDALVLDVKVGSGAFMKDERDARELAHTMVKIGHAMGKKVVALLTDMEQPLGLAVGNALEVAESIEVLSGGGPPDVVALTTELGAWMLVLGGAVDDVDSGRAQIRQAMADGSGLAKFREIVERQHGDASVIDDPRKLPQASEQVVVEAPTSGYVTAIDARAIGVASMELGGGRARVEDDIDPAVGVMLRAKRGTRVEEGDALAVLHVNAAPAEETVARVRQAYQIEAHQPAETELIRGVIENQAETDSL